MREQAPSADFPDERVGEQASREDAEDGCNLEVGCGVKAGHREAHVEFLIEECGHPCKKDDRNKVRSDEDENQQQDHRVLENFEQAAEAVGCAALCGARLIVGWCGFAKGRGGFGEASLGLDEQTPKNDAEQDAGASEEQEARAPAVVLARESGERAAGDAPSIDGRLVQRHGSRTRGGGVVVADERHGRRKVEGLAQAAERAADDELRVGVAERGGRRRARTRR